MIQKVSTDLVQHLDHEKYQHLDHEKYGAFKSDICRAAALYVMGGLL
jgi:hypothetical protein